MNCKNKRTTKQINNAVGQRGEVQHFFVCFSSASGVEATAVVLTVIIFPAFGVGAIAVVLTATAVKWNAMRGGKVRDE